MSARSTTARLPKKKTASRVKNAMTMKTRTNKSAMLSGRPRKWNRDKIVRTVCERISEGELVVDVCKDLGIKHLTLMTFVDETEEFRLLYARSRKMQSHAIAQRGMKVSRGKDAVSLERKKAIAEAEKHWKRKDPKNWRQRVEKLKSGLIARNRLELDAIKWYTRVTNPKEFGDKVDVTSDDKPLNNGPQTMIVQFRGVKKEAKE